MTKKTEARRSGPQFQDERRELKAPRIGYELSAHDEEVPIVLRVDSSVVVHGCGRISRTDGKLLEDVLNKGPSLSDSVEISVFTVGIDHAICINHGRVHAPLKTVRVVRNTGQAAVRIARAALGVGVLEAPLNVHVGIQLRNKVLFRPQE